MGPAGNGATDAVINDLHAFDDHNHLPRLPVDVIRTPADGDFSDDSGNGEWDIESILSICPFREADSLRMLKTLAESGVIGF